MDINGENQIIKALELTFDPGVSNEKRREAQVFLESVKSNEESPFWGYQLSLPENNGQGFIVRHFGLSLIQNTVNASFDQLNIEKVHAIRSWIIELANKIESTDPHYLKEKLAFLWVSVSKKIWGNFLIKYTADDIKRKEPELQGISETELTEGWASMDSDLWNLYERNLSCRELCLIILRTLLEDIYLLDDAEASRRGPVLNQLSILIMTPSEVLEATYEPNPILDLCKLSKKAWFMTLNNLLVEILLNNDFSSSVCQVFVPKILSIFKACLHWIQPIVLQSGNIIQTLMSILQIPDVKFKTLAVDCLHILFTRSYNSEEYFQFFIDGIFTSEGVSKLSQFYSQIEINPEDIDEQDYALLKKTTEMIISLSEYFNTTINHKYKISWENSDIGNYLRLVLRTTNHPSLIVSGLSLQMWVSILRLDELSTKKEILEILPDLLEMAANRSINYAILDENHPSRCFLDLDFDSINDAKPFLSNYGKYNEDIVRITVCKKPLDGLSWLESRLENFFISNLGKQSLFEDNLSDTSDAFNYGCAQFNIIENCIKGISRWRIWYTGSDYDSYNDTLNKYVESLGERLLAMNLASPLLIRQQVKTLVQFAPLLKDISPLMFNVLEKILRTSTFEYPEGIDDERRELIRDLRTTCGTELNRLAYIMPESLRKIFVELESVIASVISSKKVSHHESVAFKSFLLVIASRSSIEEKNEIFAKIVDPELMSWSTPETEQALMNLHNFMERLGIVEIAKYFDARGIDASTNLLESKMDEEGRVLKNNLKEHWSSIFQIRATRIFIQYSIEKLSHDSPEYLHLLSLWKPRVQPIIPHIFELIAQIQRYHDPQNWRDLPPAIQSFIWYSCTERFWHQGVSIQSKETFMEENVKATLTLREFADSVGHLVRYTREYAYLTVGSLAQLEDVLYEIPNIGKKLWDSVAGDTVGITLHSWKHMLNSCIRTVIKNCPPKYTEPFMMELLPPVLTTLDTLLLAKWEKVYVDSEQFRVDETDESLSEEMMEEHMLRQLTATVVRLLMDVVSHANSKSLTPVQVESKKLVVNSKEILAPFLRICCHLISFKDTKCSFNTILVIRNILPDILLKDEEVDKYLCENLIKSLVQVLMDDYFVETHSEAAVAFTTLYCILRSKNDHPARVLIQVFPSATTNHICNFESLLINSKSFKGQKTALLELVKLIKDPAQFSTDEELRKRKEQLEDGVISIKKKDQSDLMDDPVVEDGGLNRLFGDE